MIRQRPIPWRHQPKKNFLVQPLSIFIFHLRTIMKSKMKSWQIGWFARKAFLNDGTSYSPPSMFDPANIASGGVFPPHPFLNSVANYQPTVSGSVLPDTSEQAPIDHYGEALDPLSHLSHHAPRHQGSLTVSQPAEEEDQHIKPARKRRRTAKG